MPTVTIAVLTYNRRALLQETLKGVLAQTYRDFELLICDNASSDDTAGLVAGIQDPRVVYVRRGVNGGAFANFREGYRNLLALAMTRRRLFVFGFIAVTLLSFALVPQGRRWQELPRPSAKD